MLQKYQLMFLLKINNMNGSYYKEWLKEQNPENPVCEMYSGFIIMLFLFCGGIALTLSAHLLWCIVVVLFSILGMYHWGKLII